MYYYIIRTGFFKTFVFVDIVDAVRAFCMLMSAFGIDIDPVAVYPVLLKESSFEVFEDSLRNSSFAGCFCSIQMEQYKEEELEKVEKYYKDRLRDLEGRLQHDA